MGGTVGKEMTQREKQGRADDFPNQRIFRMLPRNVLCHRLNICSYFISLLMMSWIGPRGDRKSWQPLLK